MAWQGVMPGERPRKAASRSLGPAVGRHGDRRREQGVAAGAGDQQRGYHQQAGGQGARDRLALPARPGHVPPVDGDFEGGRGGHRAVASGQPAISTTWRWWPGPIQASSSSPARSRNARAGSAARTPSSGGGVQANASGFDALTERGQ